MQGCQGIFQTYILSSSILYSTKENVDFSSMVIILNVLVIGILNKLNLRTIVYVYKTGPDTHKQRKQSILDFL